MRKILVSLVVMLSIAGGSLILVPRVSAIRRQENLWQASLVPSSPEICGHFQQNMATRGLDKGVVTVAQSGLVEINIARLTILSSGEIDANHRHRRRSSFCLWSWNYSLRPVHLKRPWSQIRVHHWIYSPSLLMTHGTETTSCRRRRG